MSTPLPIIVVMASLLLSAGETIANESSSMEKDSAAMVVIPAGFVPPATESVAVRSDTPASPSAAEG